jgi:LacI family transcriptional regulator
MNETSQRESKTRRDEGSRGGSPTITAAMLAAKLGLSRSTVSIVLRGDAERRKISPETVARVLEAAQKYNYVPNLIAQRLRRQRSDIIAVIVVNFRLDWCEELMGGVLQVLDESPLTPFVTTHRNNPQRQEKELLAAISRRDDAIICQPIPGQTEIYQRVLRSGIPLIFLGDYPPQLPHVSRVIWDSGEAARVAVNHLLDTGRRRIGYIGMEYPLAMHINRYRAYETGLRDAGLSFNPHWVVHAPPGQSINEILDPAIHGMFANGADRPDALFLMNDGLALPALEKLHKLGLKVPSDVAVIGLGNLPLTGHSSISLSTVVEPVRQMGLEAAKVSLELIADPSKAPIERVIHSTDLLARRTTEQHP